MSERFSDEVLQRALDAFVSNAKRENAEGYAAMRAVLEGQECVWAPDDDRSMWDTGCGQSFNFFDNGLKENGTRFCQYCGRAVWASDCPKVAASWVYPMGAASDGSPR